MRILYLDADTTAARALHGQLLSYKGVYWDLEHYLTAPEATAALMREAYDVVLVRLKGNEIVEGELLNFVEAGRTLPMVGLIDPVNSDLHSQWLQLGFADILLHDNLTGELVMRRLRIAAARLDRQSQQLQRVVNKLLHAPVRSGDAVGELQEDAAFLTRWMAREIVEDDKLHIAILREHGSQRLLDGAEEHAQISVFRDFESYLTAVELQTTIDVAVVDQEMLEREGSRVFEKLQLQFPAPPLILISSDRSDAGAVSQVLEGFDDCLPARNVTTSNLLRLIELSLARWEYSREQVQLAIRNAPAVNDRRKTQRSGAERRVGSRYLVTRPLLAIPVLADGSPDRANIREAFSIDFAVGGLGFQISNHAGIPGRNWIIGVETDGGDGQGERFHYCHVHVRNVSYPQGGVRMGAQFQTPALDMLNVDNLLPSLDADRAQFQNRIDSRAADQWIDLGVLKRKLLHRIHTCPECHGIATAGRGCWECGSPEIRFQEMMHHFACAAVADSSEFQRDGSICCPKCFASALMIGVDFELIHSRYECLECSHQGSQIADVSTCLRCRLRFPTSMAVEEEVHGYDVDRLDVLALLNTAD